MGMKFIENEDENHYYYSGYDREAKEKIVSARRSRTVTELYKMGLYLNSQVCFMTDPQLHSMGHAAYDTLYKTEPVVDGVKIEKTYHRSEQEKNV